MTIKSQLKKESKQLINPSLKQKTMAQFHFRPSYKKRLVMPFAILVTAVVLLFIDKPKTNHYLIVSINPSVLIHYEDQTTKSVSPLNEDAVILLHELDLVNQPLLQTIQTIETKARSLGYLNPISLSHLDKDNLDLPCYEVSYHHRKTYITTLKEKGYTDKALNTTDDDLIKLMFNTDQDHLTQLASVIHNPTSKINHLIQSTILDNQSEGEGGT